MPLIPEVNLSCVEKDVNIPCMEALKLPKVIKDCITGKSKRNEKIVVGEHVSAIVQNHLPSKYKDPNFLENEFLQDEYPALSIEEKAELEAFSKSNLFNTQGLSEEIEAAIMGWCNKREHTSLAESCKLPNPEERTSQCELLIPKAEKELLLSAIQPPNLELKSLPANMKYAYLKENDTLSDIINGDLKRSQEEELIKMLKRHEGAISLTLTDITGISLVISMHYISLQENVKLHGVPRRNVKVATRKDWKERFDHAFWACRTTYKTSGIRRSKWVEPYVRRTIMSNRAIKIQGVNSNSTPLLGNGNRHKVYLEPSEICVMEAIPLYIPLVQN